MSPFLIKNIRNCYLSPPSFISERSDPIIHREGSRRLSGHRPSSEPPSPPWLSSQPCCYFKLRLPAKICTLLITRQLLCALSNAFSQSWPIHSEGRSLNVAWVPGRGGAGAGRIGGRPEPAGPGPPLSSVPGSSGEAKPPPWPEPPYLKHMSTLAGR